MVATVRGIPSDTCKTDYKITISPQYQFCAGGRNGEGACSGDSGGPIMEYVQNGLTKYHYIAGIVQGGTQCTLYTLYTRVDAYLEWIFENLK